MSFYLKKKWSRKPSAFVRAKKTGMAKKLVHAYFFTESGNVLKDAASDSNGSIDALNVSRIITKEMQTLDYSGAGIAIRVGTQKAFGVNDGATWACRVFIDSSSTETYRTIYGNRYEGVSTPLQFVKVDLNGFQYYNGATDPGISYTWTKDKWITIVVTKIGSSFKIYEDAVLKGTGTTSSTMSENPIYFLYGGSGGKEPTLGMASWSMFFHRGLSESEVVSLTKDPHQVLEPKKQFIPVIITATTGFQAAWAAQANITMGFK